MFSISSGACSRLLSCESHVDQRLIQMKTMRTSLFTWEHFDHVKYFFSTVIASLPYRSVTVIRRALEKPTEGRISNNRVRDILYYFNYSHSTKENTLQLTTRKREARVHFSKLLLEENIALYEILFSNIVFSDETYFQEGDTSRKSWQSPTDRVPMSRTHHPIKVMLWGAIDKEGNILYHWCDNFTEFCTRAATRLLELGEKSEIPQTN